MVKLMRIRYLVANLPPIAMGGGGGGAEELLTRSVLILLILPMKPKTFQFLSEREIKCEQWRMGK